MTTGFALLLETFRQEATELLDELAGLLEATRKGAREPAALVAARRVAHNLKGAALTVGVPRLAEPCHLLEDEFEAMARSSTPIPRESLERWLQTVTELQGLAQAPNLVEIPATPSMAVGPAVPAEATIRVETRRLDDVMGHVREVAQTQSRCGRRGQELQGLHLELVQAMTNGAPLGEIMSRLATVITEGRQEVQEFGYLVDALGVSINQVRMTPLAGMTALWQRAMRETTRELDRSVELELAVGDVEVDLHLYELLKDPLLHVLRNAVAHGIEPAEARRAAGKPTTGRVRLEARADGAFVTLRVSDDGRGIEPERIAEHAVARGWVSAEAAAGLSDTERRALIFLPGFSTAEAVTTVAGRGMGLHSVQRNLEELGGAVTVSATPELGGTTFELRIPATVLNVQGLLVRAGSVTYTFPLHDVAQVAAAEVSELAQSEGAKVFRDALGRPVPVRELAPLLGQSPGKPQKKLNLVVLRRAGQELALAVDEVVGEQAFVTRPLPWNLEGTPGINGTLILPDGSVALSLDPTHLFAAAEQARSEGPEAAARPARRVLVVDDTASVRAVVSRTLSRAGYEVTTCIDGQEAWELVQREPFALVVSDIQMPHLDGLELTTRIRASATLRRLPIVLVTGLATPEDVARGAEAGADEYVVKGDRDQERLLRAIRRLLP